MRPGVLNCYEDLFPWYARELARARPDFLVNVTNYAWFFETSEPHLHHMAARIRAIETRQDLVHVTTTGLTGHVDALGRRVTPSYRESWQSRARSASRVSSADVVLYNDPCRRIHIRGSS